MSDVYSFAIVVYEVLYRRNPYEIDGQLPMTPEEIISRVGENQSPPFRPSVPDTHNETNDLVQLMFDCWTERPNDRPDFNTIKKRFANMNAGKYYNIIDNMLRMMETYTNNLEDAITARTKELTHEKEKTDMLLYRMMPPTVADCLKTGKPYEPELFKNVTIYFSDIVSFTRLASEAKPMEVVDFLNDLWNVFDDVILKYNVYKVETIGDAYLVASGLPSAQRGAPRGRDRRHGAAHAQ
ncbi:Retinal guanylyl cyclase 1 [Lamellibrachia satsuma]|nr:Retinal guanylyl cyclase 1 [Lamellibrachia satsuma]